MLSIRRVALVGAFSLFAGLLALPMMAQAAEDKDPVENKDPVESKEPAEKKDSAEEKDTLWTTDFEAAKAKAKEEKKLLLVDFTGSDWCGWCIRLKDEVFNKEEFKKEGPKQFVLVELDYPNQKKLPDELKAQNEKLAKQYKIRGFPTILVMDAEGQVVARTGYRAGGPEKYVAHLGEFVKAYESIVELRGKLKDIEGLDRAKLLDQLVEAYVKLDNEIDEIDAWSKEIVKLDADNKAGLKNKYEFRILMAEAIKLKEAKKFDEARAAIDKALALPGATAEQKQDALFAQGECFFNQKDFAGTVACLKKALAAAPESEKAESLKGMIARFAPMAEAQEALAKLKAELEKAEGVDRAKVLDKLIEAVQKLGPMAAGNDVRADVEKWSEEIVKLDPENKTGLKVKYELAAARAEGMKLMRAKKADEAMAMIDKILAGPGITAENRQQGLAVKGLLYFFDRDFEKGLDTYKKALEAAPESAQVAEIKTWIGRCEGELQKQKAKDEPKEESEEK